ncbi:MAG TPA: potassium channel family protein [Burkholderiales bacterium]|nr:potassium channel family protein [Burkholderiales bacterium]
MLRLLSFSLVRLAVQTRAKLLLVIFGTFTSHALQVLLYAIGYAALAEGLNLGKLSGGTGAFTDYLYFSAETYTSLGFGDLIPVGPLRFVAGVETLNGLLLIGWSASYIYISMERFWTAPNGSGR